MKQIEVTKPVFQPVTIQIETQEELNFFRQVCGSTPGYVFQDFGIENWKSITEFWNSLDGLTTKCPSLQTIKMQDED